MNYIYTATDYTIKSIYTKSTLKLYLYTNNVKCSSVHLKYQLFATSYFHQKQKLLKKYTPELVITTFENKSHLHFSQREYIFIYLMLKKEITNYVNYFIFENLVKLYGY